MEPHIHVLGTFWLDLLLITPSAKLLLICIDVLSCLWLSMDSIMLINRAPSSASAADNMTALMIFKIVSTAPLFGGNRELFDM